MVKVGHAGIANSKARVPVAGTMNGFPFRNSLMPEGDGTHSMMVGKAVQAGAKAKAGDVVLVSLEVDTQERGVTLPQELDTALKGNHQAASFFATLAPSHKAEYANWIASAKKLETRESRVSRTIEMLIAGRKRIR
jgi:uncharacterized protein YdeI (YjbR/CyaY-like superfamily)